MILVLWNIKKYVIESEIQKLKWLKYNYIKKEKKQIEKCLIYYNYSSFSPQILFIENTMRDGLNPLN